MVSTKMVIGILSEFFKLDLGIQIMIIYEF